MHDDKLLEQILNAWQVNQRVNTVLLRAVSAKGLKAVPHGSKGRNVSQVFSHMYKVRFAWLRYNGKNFVKGLPRFPRAAAPKKSELKNALGLSEKAVSILLKKCLLGERSIQMFKKNPVRWMSYLISHESHHRGQIALALKQNGMRLPPNVALRGLWQEWYSGSL
jgi:uncharacterized damage-inducible protein DinB